MKLRINNKHWMIAAGILAAVVILVSPAFQCETTSFLSKAKAKTEQPTETNDTIIAVHSDAVTSGQACTVETVNPFVLQEIIKDDNQQVERRVPGTAIIASLFKTLLRTVISPQAP
ncbi:MAG: hypothetical protein JNK10_01705 [Cyclobacteriaceae bacterium]|nr:hypothetical protein [Cyclobacteriaceae bacterium]